jgi:hypothetical protein
MFIFIFACVSIFVLGHVVSYAEKCNEENLMDANDRTIDELRKQVLAAAEKDKQQ